MPTPSVAGGLSHARLGRTHEVLGKHVESGGVPGLVALVSRRGEIHADVSHLAGCAAADCWQLPRK